VASFGNYKAKTRVTDKRRLQGGEQNVTVRVTSFMHKMCDRFLPPSWPCV